MSSGGRNAYNFQKKKKKKIRVAVKFGVYKMFI